MWETFISWYINNYLGRYVENLNSQQLSFALRQGELELENVPLKKNIFRSWGLPIEVRSEVVGRIKIEFNLLKYLRNEPVLITIEDIYLVAGPLNLAEWDPLEEGALTHETKMTSLDAHESRWKAQFDLDSDSPSYYSSLYFSSMRIGASIVTKLVENVQFNIHNIHIRFEEDYGNLGRVVAFGLTLQSLTAQSCDSSWNPLSFASSSQEYSFKTVQLRKFGVYCDTKGERFSHVKPQDLRELMSRLGTTHEYILHPVSAEARITKNNSPQALPTTSRVRFDVNLILEKVPLQLTDSQYRQSVRSFKGFRKLNRNCHLRHYRPYSSIKENPKEWWEYGVRAVLSIRGHKRRKLLRAWEEILVRAKDNVTYVSVYEQHLRGNVLSSELTRLKERVETDLHFDEIIQLRQVAMRRIEMIPTSKIATTAAATTVSSTPPEESEEASALLPETTTSTTPQSGILSWLFPSWTGQANASDEIDATKLESDQSSDILALRSSESDLDEAIRDDMKAYGRDALLARFNFVLRRGSVTLNRRNGPFLELEFNGVELQTELRPRSGAHKFQMTLATILLRDCSTKSMIISPHHSVPTSLRKISTPVISTSSEDPLFSFIYERKPHRKAGRRAIVRTKALNLNLYPAVWDDVSKYFTVKDFEDDLDSPHFGYEAVKQRTREELRLYWERLVHLHQASNSQNGGVSWEIYMDICAPQIVIHGSKSTFKNIVEYNKASMPDRRRARSQSNSGDETFQPFLVIDLGRFRFSNVETDIDNVFGNKSATATTTTQVESGSSGDNNSAQTQATTNIIHEDDNDTESDDEFLTPCSSPVPEIEDSKSRATSSRPSITELNLNSKLDENVSDRTSGIQFGDSLEDLQAKLYKKYRLEITDVQVLVVEGKGGKEGNWSTAISRGISTLHLVDRFSIDLKLERRLIYSEDPLWPALILVATLPKLNLHFNEAKILTIKSISKSFFNSDSSSLGLSKESREQFDLSFLSGSQLNLHEIENYAADKTNLEEDAEVKSKKKKEKECKLFLAQFTIQQVSVELQSLGRSIAELQIIGARTSFTRRAVDTSISFVIHSLLLADAIQTYGPDFELLLASHKHVSMDSVSGSLRDSEPTSPQSPIPMPTSPTPGATGKLAVPSQLHDALLTSLSKSKKSKVNAHGEITTPTLLDSDALITAEFVLVHQPEEEMAIVSVQFNNLDVIANQETIIEILQFLHRVSPSSSDSEIKVNPEVMRTRTSSLLENTTEDDDGNSNKMKIQANFDFHRLNILLLRGIVGKDGQQCARKIATATACDARVNFSVKGFLGGLQMLNLTPEGQYHQRVLSVGKDLLVDSTYNVFGCSERTDEEGEEITTRRHLKGLQQQQSHESALNFKFEKILNQSDEEQSSTPPSEFTLRMASVIYTHCPIFLIDLKRCISEFQTPLATKLKSAAAQIAFGLVRSDTLQNLNTSIGYRSPFGSLSGSLEKLDTDELNSTNLNSTQCQQPQKEDNHLILDVVLDSPILVLPRTKSSPSVLVAHLGKITISGNHNDIMEQEFPSFCEQYNQEDDGGGVRYNVLISDVSLYSLSLKERWNMIESLKMTYPTSSNAALMRAQELYYCDSSVATPILHNTVIQFNIFYTEECHRLKETVSTNQNQQNTFGVSYGNLVDDFATPQLDIQGRVLNPLKVSLTPQQYSQLLDSLSNIAGGDDHLSNNEVDIHDIAEPQRHHHQRMSRKGAKIPQQPLPSPTRSSDDSLPISACFDIPQLIVELVLPEEQEQGKKNKKKKSESESDTHPQLSLSCAELSFKCDKRNFVTEMDICLKSLSLEDTQEPLNSSRRILAISKLCEKEEGDKSRRDNLLSASSLFSRTRNVSTSCPDIQKSSPLFIPTTVETPYSNYSFTRTESTSLPDHLDPSEIFTNRFIPLG